MSYVGGFGTGLTALVVEDDDAVAVLMSRLLESEGFNVVTASSLQEAVKCSSVVRCDLAVTDKQLPDGSGMSLARMLAESGTDCAVVMMSAFADVESAVEAIQLDVADYLVKPFRRQDVLARLKRVVQIQTLKRRNRDLVEHLKRTNRELEAMVMRDPLTGLYNHAYLMDRLEAEAAGHRRANGDLGVLFIDVDDFTRVNETLGHAAGDWVLKVLSRIIGGQADVQPGSLMRSQDVASRYGGDEFVLLLPDTPKAGAAVKADRLRQAVEQHKFDAGIGAVTLSIGVAALPGDGNTRAELLSAADTALHAAKALGRNRVVGYTKSFATLTRDRILENEEARHLLALDRSIAAKSFRFAYQPIVHAASSEVFAYEALCRPEDTAFSSTTAMFDCAERAGRIWELGRIVRELVVKPMSELPEPALLFVNVHPYELYDPGLLESEPFLDPWAHRVVLEVTEVGEVRDYGRLGEAIKRLQARGYKVALDDLGAGYSGLNSLAQLDADFVKLDIGLLQSIHADSRSSRLIKHILEFAAGEDIRVVAEGIETEAEREIVTALGCPLLQGYLFARPGPPFVRPEVR